MKLRYAMALWFAVTLLMAFFAPWFIALIVWVVGGFLTLAAIDDRGDYNFGAAFLGLMVLAIDIIGALGFLLGKFLS